MARSISAAASAGQRPRLRINAGYSGGNTPVDGQSDSLLGVTVGFDFRSERTRLDATSATRTGTLSRRRRHGPDAGLRVPAAPNGTLNHYQPWGFYATNDTYGDLRFEHDILSNLTGYVKVGGTEVERFVAARLPDDHECLGRDHVVSRCGG